MAVMILSCEEFHATVPFKSDVLDRVSCLWVDLNQDCSGWLTGKILLCSSQKDYSSVTFYGCTKPDKHSFISLTAAVFSFSTPSSLVVLA